MRLAAHPGGAAWEDVHPLRGNGSDEIAGTVVVVEREVIVADWIGDDQCIIHVIAAGALPEILPFEISGLLGDATFDAAVDAVADAAGDRLGTVPRNCPDWYIY